MFLILEPYRAVCSFVQVVLFILFLIVFSLSLNPIVQFVVSFGSIVKNYHSKDLLNI